jgi:PST family polysaccharide transporter
LGDEATQLHGKVRVALRWSFINSLLTRFGQVGVSIALAHLIAPREFGVYAAALVVINIVLSVAELGVSTVIIRATGDISRVAPTVVTLSLVSSAVLAGACMLGAPTFASALGAPEATGVIRLLSVAILVSGVAAVPGAILQREFRQDHKLIADAASFVLSTVVVIALALAGFGPWALAWSRIVAHVTAAAVMIFFTKERYWPGFDRAIARDALAFSLPLAGASLLVFGVMNVDYIVVGSTLGPVELGFYLIAFNLSSWPVTAISSTIRTVSMAGFSQMRHREAEMRRGFGRSLSILMSLAMPACVLLAALAAPLIGFVYGERWLPSAGALAVLSVLGLLRVALELAYDYLAAAGRSRAIFAVHLVWLVGLVPCLAIGAQLDGIQGVAWGHVVCVVLLVTPCYLYALRRTGLRASTFAAGLARPLAAGAAMAIVAVAVSRTVSGDVQQLIVGSAAALAVYAALMLVGDSGLLAARSRRHATEGAG